MIATAETMGEFGQAPGGSMEAFCKGFLLARDRKTPDALAYAKGFLVLLDRQNT